MHNMANIPRNAQGFKMNDSSSAASAQGRSQDNEAFLRRNNEHYIRVNRILSYAVIALILVVFFAVSFSIKIWNHHPEPKLLGLTVDNRILPLPLLNKPFESSGIAIEWANKNIRRLYTFTYDNLGDLPTEVANLFYAGEAGDDSRGVDSYIKGLKAQGFFSLIQNEKRLCTAFLSDETRVLEQRVFGKGEGARYGYRMQTPLNVQCKNERDVKTFSRVVTTLAVRGSPTLSPNGLVIAKVNSMAVK